MRSSILTSKRAKALRRALTEPEVMLWARLKRRHPDTPAFRNQHPMGPYILDFYCAKAKLERYSLRLNRSGALDVCFIALSGAEPVATSAESALAVEIDGAGHSEDAQVEHDRRRDAWLRRRGLTVSRVPASSVFEDADEVAHGARVAADALIAERGAAPSTIGSSLRSADGPPPSLRRGGKDDR